MSAPSNRKPWLVASGLTAAAIAVLFTSPHEGVKYTAYPDVGNVWTICVGHTKDVYQGETATPSQCDAWLAQDMQQARIVVGRCIQVPLNVNQAAALYDSVFNLGPQVVCGSTLQRMANAGDMTGMCDQLPRWNRAAGRVWVGLTTRRLDARELCLYPTQNKHLVYPFHWIGSPS